jgi:serine/threonine protein kinase
MALTAGTKLGPYEIVSPLGAGGMGEVYRARDARLERTVAIKVLNSNLRILKIKLCYDAPQLTFGVRLDIFYPPILDRLKQNRSFSTATGVHVHYRFCTIYGAKASEV